MHKISVFEDNKDKPSDLFGLLQDNLNNFFKSIPIIEHLKNPALRMRHWSQLKDQISNMEFMSPQDDGLNFELLSRPELIANDARIKEISKKAKHEKESENGIENIRPEWQTNSLKFDESKNEKGESMNFKISKDLQLEIVFEKHTQELATYKVSGYEKFFMKDIELWEKKLTNIIDSFEFLLMVQKN